MNISRWIVVLFFLITPATAWDINNSQYVYQINNANISFPTNQSYTSIATGTDFITLDGSRLQITSDAGINISINQFSVTNNYYNVSFNGTANVNYNHIVPTAGRYYVTDNGVFVGYINTVLGVLYNSIALNGLDIITWSYVNTPISVIACQGVQNDINTAFTLIGVLLIVASTGALIHMLISRNFNTMIIVPAIVMIIVGSIMILVGYSLVVTVEGITC